MHETILLQNHVMSWAKYMSVNVRFIPIKHFNITMLKLSSNFREHKRMTQIQLREKVSIGQRAPYILQQDLV